MKYMETRRVRVVELLRNPIDVYLSMRKDVFMGTEHLHCTTAECVIQTNTALAGFSVEVNAAKAIGIVSKYATTLELQASMMAAQKMSSASGSL